MRRWFIPCCTWMLASLTAFAGCSDSASTDEDDDTEESTGSTGRATSAKSGGSGAKSGSTGSKSGSSGTTSGKTGSTGKSGSSGKSGTTSGKTGSDDAGSRPDTSKDATSTDGAKDARTDAAKDSAPRPDAARDGGCRPAGCTIAEGMIADFEEGAPPTALLGLNSAWGMFNDESTTSQTLSIVSTGTEACKKQALNTTGKGYIKWGAGIALTLDAGDEMPELVDWSDWKGISFKAKGNATTKSVRFDLVTKWSDDALGECLTNLPDTDPNPNKCYNHLGTWISDLTSEYKTYTFCFNDMVPSWLPTAVSAAQRAQIAKNIDKLQFHFKAPPVGTTPDKPLADFDFSVDDIQLVKTTAACQTTVAPTGTPAAKFPFPQNKKFAGCSQPLGWDQLNGAVARAFLAWKKQYVVRDGAGFRVQRPENNNDTVSEGIGYGMLISVYMGDKELFDGLWAFAKSKGADTSFMGWRAGSASEGGATDADEDMAFALIQADKQWGGYATEAKGLIGRILASEVEAGTNVIKGGSNNFGGSSYTNPSYFAPAFYKTFAKFTGETRWNAVATKAYEVLNACTQGRANGLVPDWCTASGEPKMPQGTVVQEIRFGFDAVRTPWRIATDACWNSDKAAQSYLARISDFFAKIGVPAVRDGYLLDGKPADRTALNSMAYIGLTGTGAMGSTSAVHGTYRDDAFRTVLDLVTMPAFNGTYYNTTLGVLSLLVMSGNFVDFTQ